MTSIARFAVRDKMQVVIGALLSKTMLLNDFVVAFLTSHSYDPAMNHRAIVISRVIALIGACLALVCPVKTSADTANSAASVSPIIITEMQPGTEASASQEFIELYNQSTSSIDFRAGGWQVQIASSKATSWSGAKVIKLTGTFYPGTYLLLSSTYMAPGDTKSYLQDYATAQFSPGLTALSGHIRVGNTLMSSPGDLQSVDNLEWSESDANSTLVSPGIDNGVVFSLNNSLAPGTSIKRAVDSAGIFEDAIRTDAMSNFLVSTCPSPTANNIVPSQPLDATVLPPLATTIDVDNPSCSTEPPDNSGDDTGTSPIVPPTTEPPAVLVPSDPSTTTTTMPSSTTTIPTTDVGLTSPQLTELLPNPGAPQTDADDEFIELYNSNDQNFDLSGFVIATGATKKYTFPKRTILPAHAFTAFFSGNTHLSLSNSGGQVILYDPLGNKLGQTTTYSAAKDNMAWALANGVWQWTSRPTPNAQNVIAIPTTKVAKTAVAKVTTKKPAATKAAATKKKAAAKTQSTANMVTASDMQPNSPLHPVTLAVVGGFALLYGAYEYRRDMANKLHQLRSYRTARREARQQPKGR